MLAAWYFCSCLGVTIRQSADYLEILEILRSEESDSEQLTAAVEKLADCEPSVRLHGLTYVLSAAQRDAFRSVATLSAATQLCDGLVEWAAPADRGRREALGTLLAESLGAPRRGYFKRISETLRACKQRVATTYTGMTPYQDIGDSVHEILALTLLAFAAEQRPADALGDCVGDDRPEVVTDALANRLGRLPLLLAVSAVLSVSPREADDEVRAAVRRAGRSSADLEPDLLTVAARSWFPPPGGNQEDFARRIENELGTGLLLRGWAGEQHGARERRGTMSNLLGRTPAGLSDVHVRTALWQLVLWERFAECAPAPALAAAARWWGAPARHEKRTLPNGALAVLPSAGATDSERQAAVDWISATVRKDYAHDNTPSVTSHDDPDGAPPYAVCSPWLWRNGNFFFVSRETRKEKEGEKGAISSWYKGWNAFDVLRVAALAPVAVRLLRAARTPASAQAVDGRRATDPAVAFLFHAKDVFTDRGCWPFLDALRTQSRPDNLTMDARLAALVWHADRAVGRAGRGLYPEIPVALFADFLISGPGDMSGPPERTVQPHPHQAQPQQMQQKKQQWYLLFSRPALNGARDWIKESSAGARRTETDEADGPGWFDGSAPHARRVLMTAAERLLPLDRDEHQKKADKACGVGEEVPPITHSSTKPFVSALREHFTSKAVPTAFDEIDRDWMSRLPRLVEEHQKKQEEARLTGESVVPGLRTNDLLVADPCPAADWQYWQESIGLLVPDPYDPETWRHHPGPFEEFIAAVGPEPLTVQTLRVAALLAAEDPAVIRHGEEWISSWRRLMSGINDRRHLGRFIRGVALDMFATPDRGVDAQERVRGVLETVVDSIVAFSADAPRYYQRLLSVEALRPEDDMARPLPPEGMNRLRARALEAVRRRQWHEQRAPEPTTAPWEVLDRRRARAEIDAQVRAFVAVAATEELTSSSRQTLGKTFLRAWERQALSLPGRRSDKEEDPRLVVSQGVRHRTGESWSDLGSWQPGRGKDGTRAVDLGPLSPEERRARLERWRKSPMPRSVFGMVCSRDRSDAGARINWGAGVPLTVRDGGNLAVGDPCVVQVTWDEARQVWQQTDGDTAYPAGRADPRDGEVREAWVGYDNGRLRVTVDGVPGNVLDKDPHAALRWEPDLSQVVPERDGPSSSLADTPARWVAAAKQWLPVDRTLTELVADDLPYTAPEDRRATVLVYVGQGEADRPEESGAWRFSTAAGRSYLLWPQDWQDPRQLVETLTPPARGANVPDENDRAERHEAPAPGMLVYAGLRQGLDPRLELLPGPPVGADARWPALASGGCRDTRNVDWLRLFDEPEARPWRASKAQDIWQVKVDDIPGYPVGAGFPPEVKVEGVEAGKGDDRPFQPLPWDEVAARTAIVTGELLRVQRLVDAADDPAEARFDEFWRVRPQDTFPVRWMRRPGPRTGGTISASAGEGFPVQLERAGLVFEEWPVHGLEVRIKKVTAPTRSQPRASAPLPGRDLCAQLGAKALADGELEGVVVELVRRLDGRIDSYGVWLRARGEVPRRCSVPSGAFCRPVFETGATFLGVSTEEGWHFTPRRVYGTPLYRADRVPDGTAASGENRRFMGLVGRGGERESALYARPDSADVVIAPPPPERPPVRGTLREALGTEPGRSGGIPLVLARIGASHVVGTLPRVPDGQDVMAERVAVTGTHFEVVSSRPVPGSNGTELIGLRRGFDVGPLTGTAAGSTPSPSRTREQDWRAAIAAGEPATETGTLVDGHLRVAGHRVPLHPDDGPFVEAVHYSTYGVRARIVEHEGELRASTRLAPPLDVAEFADHFDGTVSGKGRRTCVLRPWVHYVGAFEENGETRWRFEWGRGHTVALRHDELTYEGKPCGGEFPLFHGDRLKRVTFGTDAGTGRVTVDFRQGDIGVQAGTRVAREAADHGLVHQITVIADPGSGTVRVERVRLTRLGPRPDSEHFEDRRIAALLAPDDVSKVLRLLGDSAAATELCVLARFEHGAYVPSQGTKRVFHYVEPRFVGPEDSGVHARNRLFMVADRITRDALGLCLSLKLPGSVRQPAGAEPLTVRVGPRDFSVRPYLLRRIHDDVTDSDNEDDRALRYSGAVFLVEVSRDEAFGTWRGVLTSAPARDPRTLVSAVKVTGTLLAAVADGGGQNVEVLPGVIFKLPPAVRKFARPGALVRLTVRDGELLVHEAQRPDHTYLLGGRAALVRAESSSPAPGRDSFTVDGLPALSFHVPESLASRLRQKAPNPQIAVLVSNRHGAQAVFPSARSAAAVRVSAGTVETRSREARLSPVPVQGNDVPQPGPVPWARLGFADGTAEDIRERWGQRHRYDDAETSATHNGGVVRAPRTPALFHDHGNHIWTLRYPPERLKDFVLPATTLTESPRQTRPDWYTVAGPARNGKRVAVGLCLELAPGRVIEVDGRLVTGPSDHPMDDLAWGRFGQGDQVLLEVVRGGLAEPRRLRLLDWRPGPRAAWSAGQGNRVWLPVRRASGKNGVELGTGHFSCSYPLADAASCFGPGGMLHDVEAVVLDGATNALSPAVDTGPASGDCALLGLDQEGTPTLLGLPHRRVELSASAQGWPGGDWLSRLLGEQPAVLLEQIGSLPVTVEHWGDDSVTVSRRLQPAGTLPERGTMFCSALAEADGGLVVRCGGALHLLPMSTVVPGLPQESAVEAARFLSRRPGQRLWCRTDSSAGHGGQPGVGPVPHVGLGLPPLSTFPDELQVMCRGVLGPEDRPSGLLLEAEHDRRWYWMPTEQASWLPDPRVKELRIAFGEGNSGQTTRVHLSKDGTVSALEVRDVERTRRGLRLGTRLRVTPVADRELPATDGLQPMVGRVLPTGALVQLRAVRKKDGVRAGESIHCEVERLDTGFGQGVVGFVTVGRRRHRVDLPERLTKKFATDAAEGQTSLREAWRGRGGKPRTVGEEVVSAAHRSTAEPEKQLPTETHEALRRWLTDHGKAAFLLMPDQDVSDGNLDLELTEVLAATLLLERHGRSSPLHARAAVLLAHQVGLRATRSLHVEPLVRSWASPDRVRTDPRLARLQFPAEMDDDQLHTARSYGNGLLGQTDGRGGEHSDAPVARAVLAAVGALPPGEDLAGGADLLSRLAALGRALHPPGGEATAQAKLDPEQYTLLHTSLLDALEAPVPLLAHPGPAPSPQQQLARLLLAEING
ncbi:hypothetical protein [Streptomyces phaeochromogenes]|uniref:hypothetical protein n=1 Tax=Streptomyces phaeochromogenes TaxID=1923 RepID=UPI0038672B85|nr:hypothetical protein OHB08_01710 [Streptomyces phaeochromogenes]